MRQTVLPLIETNPAVAESLSIVLRQVPQPWHASSTYVHEAVLAVSKVLAGDSSQGFSDPSVIQTFQKFFLSLLIDHQKEYFDSAVADETPNQTRVRLAELAAEHGVDKQKVMDALWTEERKQSAVVPDLKLAVKYAR